MSLRLLLIVLPILAFGCTPDAADKYADYIIEGDAVETLDQVVGIFYEKLDETSDAILAIPDKEPQIDEIPQNTTDK